MKNKIRPAALITGSARRIGRAMALALAEDGFDIALHYNKSSIAAAKTARMVRSLGAACDLFPADFGVEGEANRLIPVVTRRFSRLMVLVNSASVFVPSGLGAEDMLLLEEHMMVHVKAPWVLVSEFAKLARRGVVINCLDTKVSSNVNDFGAYLLSKKTLAELTKMQAVHFAPNLRVNGIAPGLILKPEAKKPGYLRQKAACVPLKRHGNVGNVIQALRFLINDDFVTGQILYVDGGEHLL